jgi:hypothetical protein
MPKQCVDCGSIMDDRAGRCDGGRLLRASNTDHAKRLRALTITAVIAVLIALGWWYLRP